MKHLIITLVLLSISLSGCQKYKRSHWITARITLYDYYSGQPINVGFSYKSKKNHFGGSDLESCESATGTHEDNVYIFEKKLERREYPLELVVASSNYVIPGAPMCSGKSFELHSGSKNEYTAYLKGIYKFNLHLENVNCTGPTDSVFIRYYETGTQVKRSGCVNESLVGYYPSFYSYVNTPNPTFRIISKKNGIIDTSYQQENLTLGTVNSVYITY